MFSSHSSEALQGVPHAVTVKSGTAALRLGLTALGIGREAVPQYGKELHTDLHRDLQLLFSHLMQHFTHQPDGGLPNSWIVHVGIKLDDFHCSGHIGLEGFDKGPV